MQRGKVFLSEAEEEFANGLIIQFKISELEAVEKVIEYKQDQLRFYVHKGNEAMVKQLKKELGIV